MSQHFPAQQMTIIITPTEDVQHEPVGEGGRGDDYLFTQHGSCRSFVTPPSGVRIFPAAFQRHHTEVENKAGEEETSRGLCVGR